MKNLLLLPLLWSIYVKSEDISSQRRSLAFVDLAKFDGYIAEEHFVTTKDGYILRLFRIPPKENCSVNKGPIVFMHGLYFSGDVCIVPGPKKAHCYIYSNNCYDVWVPNMRGTVYSRNHTTYNPDKDSKFWDFSFDEMAEYDLPSSIDYVLNITNHTQVSYIGHSQGVTILFILCIKQPEYNSKIKVGFGLSASAWASYSRLVVFQLQGILDDFLTPTGELLHKEVLHKGGLIQTSAQSLCGSARSLFQFCSYIIFALLGYNKYQITNDVLPVIVGHAPAGTSLKNFNRWGQIKNNGFSEYDFGIFNNYVKYGQVNPPLYNISKVSMKWVVIGSLNDYVADIRDVKVLVSKLSDASLCVLSETTFGHLDFIFGKDLPKYITPIILSTLDSGAYKCI